MNGYYSNEVDSHETLPLLDLSSCNSLDSSESEVGLNTQDHECLPHSIMSEVVRSSNNRMYYQLPHSIIRGDNYV